MTAEEIFKKHRVKQMCGIKTISDLDTILNAMEEYGKLIHKNTRHMAIAIIHSEANPQGRDSKIMNMPYEDIKPK